MMFRPRVLSPIFKLVENCNYSCDFCRYANHPPTGLSTMPFELMVKMLTKACEYNISQGADTISIILHGGEPLLWGKDNFRRLHIFQQDFIREHEGFSFVNGIQTNANLIDDEWIDILERLDVHIGISIDGPIEYNYHYGKQGRKESLEKVLQNIKKLQQRKFKLGILSVITEEHVGHAKEYMDFIEENGLTSPGFCYCYNPQDGCSIDQKRLADFLCDAFDIYYNSYTSFRIREFDNILTGIYGRHAGTCTAKCRQECGAFLTLSPNGDIGFCDAYEEYSYVVGNMNRDSLEAIIESERYQSIKELYLTARHNKCSDCDFLNICGCGCARSDQGEGKDRHYYFCDTVQILIKHVLNVVAHDEKLGVENKSIDEKLLKYIVDTR